MRLGFQLGKMRPSLLDVKRSTSHNVPGLARQQMTNSKLSSCEQTALLVFVVQLSIFVNPNFTTYFHSYQITLKSLDASIIWRWTAESRRRMGIQNDRGLAILNLNTAIALINSLL